MNRRVQAIVDVELFLRESGTPETATAAETGIEFPVRNIDEYKAVINYSGLDFEETNETYVFSIEVSDVVGGTYTAIATSPDMGSTTTSGRLDIPLNGKIAEQLDADSAFIRVNATLGGTTPSVDYECFLTKV